MNSPTVRHWSVLFRASSASGVALLVLVAWLLATGRWGAYVGVPGFPIYISELLIGLAVVLGLIEHRRSAVRTSPPGALRPSPWVVLLALLTWSIIRLLTGPHLTVEWLRDFAPYGYALVAFAVALRPVRVQTAQRVLLGALTAHTGWVLAAHFALLPGGLPALGKTSLFEIRADFDSTVCGVTAAWCVYLALRRSELRVRVALLVLAAINLLLVFRLLSRAGLLAAFTAFLFLALVTARPVAGWARQSARNATITTIAVLAFLSGTAVFTLQSDTGVRLLSTFDFEDKREVRGAPAAGGTAKARVQVYDKVVRYTVATPSRTAVGIGFGPNVLKDSGAAPHLDRAFPGVRAPHNILVNTFARLGFLGLLLHVTVLTIGVVMAARFFLSRQPDDLGSVCALVVVALPVAALFGVVLESPFAAVPYFWCYGWLASRPATLTPARRPTGQAEPRAEQAEPRAEQAVVE